MRDKNEVLYKIDFNLLGVTMTLLKKYYYEGVEKQYNQKSLSEKFS